MRMILTLSLSILNLYFGLTIAGVTDAERTKANQVLEDFKKEFPRSSSHNFKFNTKEQKRMERLFEYLKDRQSSCIPPLCRSGNSHKLSAELNELIRRYYSGNRHPKEAKTLYKFEEIAAKLEQKDRDNIRDYIMERFRPLEGMEYDHRHLNGYMRQNQDTIKQTGLVVKDKDLMNPSADTIITDEQHLNAIREANLKFSRTLEKIPPDETIAFRLANRFTGVNVYQDIEPGSYFFDYAFLSSTEVEHRMANFLMRQDDKPIVIYILFGKKLRNLSEVASEFVSMPATVFKVLKKERIKDFTFLSDTKNNVNHELTRDVTFLVIEEVEEAKVDSIVAINVFTGLSETPQQRKSTLEEKLYQPISQCP